MVGKAAEPDLRLEGEFFSEAGLDSSQLPGPLPFAPVETACHVRSDGRSEEVPFGGEGPCGLATAIEDILEGESGLHVDGPVDLAGQNRAAVDDRAGADRHDFLCF